MVISLFMDASINLYKIINEENGNTVRCETAHRLLNVKEQFDISPEWKKIADKNKCFIHIWSYEKIAD